MDVDFAVSCLRRRLLGRDLRDGTRISEGLRPFSLCLNMKKLFTFISLCIIAFNAIHADIKWSISIDGTLTISAYSGNYMPDYYNSKYNSIYSYNPVPWYSQRDEIKKVVIENGVRNIGNFAFEDCQSLRSVSIPFSVVMIGEGAFEGCSSLTSVNIPNSVTSIGKYAFWGCPNLTSITIPNTVTTIGDLAFCDCPSLTSITIPNSVMSIGERSFYKCSNLTSVTIPNSVTSIGNRAFGGCTNLTSLIVEKENSRYDSRNDCNAIIEKESNTLIAGCKKTIIPNTVTSLGDYAFSWCPGLTSITIPKSVTSIGEQAFSDCSALTSITIPESVTSIGNCAFFYCSGLTSIIVEPGNKNYDSRNDCNAIIEKKSNNMIAGCKKTIIPNSVTGIGERVFSGCSELTSIIIPNSVTTIGILAFSDCSGLTSIICEANIPPNCESWCFDNVNKHIPVYVPGKSVEAYRKNDGWKYFTNIQAISDIYTLADDTPYTNISQLNDHNISYIRTFNNTNWQALYIPFSLSYEDWKDDFEVAYINGVRQLDKDDNGTIDETIMDVIKIKSGSTTPNMPYLIKAKTIGEKTFSVSNATLYASKENSLDCSTTIAKYTFTGTYSSIPSATMIANNYYAMGGGDLILSDGSNDLKPYRWYMKVESRNSSYNVSNAAKSITINVIGDEEEEMTTGVHQLQITNDELPVYDLNGRKVNENSLKPGLYIKNGKKFVVK